METNTPKKGLSQAERPIRDFVSMALQILAFNLATGGRDHNSSPLVNSIGFVLLKILMERKNGRKAKAVKASTFITNIRTIFHNRKSKTYGHRQPKV